MTQSIKNLPPTSKTGSTREKLINSAVDCLAEYGFSSATMRTIANHAGVTQGPRQYYFPSTTDLYEAIVDDIHTRSNKFIDDMAQMSNASIEERLQFVLGQAFEVCGNNRHIAMIEIKLACRGDERMHNTVQPKIDQFEHDTDTAWADLFSDAACSREEVIHLRTIAAATLRGLGVTYAAGSDRSAHNQVFELLKSMFIRKLESR